LKRLGNLRNAIVYSKTREDFVIAEPHESTVDLIEKIENEIAKPKKVIAYFKKDVQTFKFEDTLSNVLTVMKEQAFSEFPVYEKEEFRGLLTEKGITNYLANQVEEELISLPETLIESVI